MATRNSTQSVWGNILFFALLLVLCGAAQWRLGGYSVAPTDNSDAPAHFVTGLMVRQYLAESLEGFPSPPPPMAFAKDYYLHYPKVALGHWPPAFYVLQAAWTGVLPPTEASVMLLILFLEAILAFLAFSLVRRYYGPLTGAAAAIALIAIPQIAQYSSEIMTEIPQAVVIAGAILVYARFLEKERWTDSAAFGLLAATALLFKGTGLALAPVPALAVALAGKWRLLARPVFWLPLPIVLLLAGPWYVLAPGARHERAMPYGGPGIAVGRVMPPPFTWFQVFGWTISILALVGMVSLLVKRFRGERPNAHFSASLAMVISGTLFPMFFAVWELRHEMEMVFPMMVLAAVGSAVLVGWLPKARLGSGVGWAWAPLALAAAIGTIQILGLSARPSSTYPEVVDGITQSPPEELGVVLISASSMGEGAFVVSLAERELKPERYIVRGTKLFADLNWIGRNPSAEAQTTEDVYAALNSVPVDLIVMDQASPAPYSYTPLLQQTITEHPGEWQPWPRNPQPDRFLIYARAGGNQETSQALTPEDRRQRLSQALGDDIQ